MCRLIKQDKRVLEDCRRFVTAPIVETSYGTVVVGDIDIKHGKKITKRRLLKYNVKK